jgi:acetyl esterase/lipase
MSIVTHELTSSDAQAMQAMRTALATAPKISFVPSSRAAFDAIIAQTPAPESVSFEPGKVGGVPGWWCVPAHAGSLSSILHLHGGGYVVGSAISYRNFVGHIARRANARAFVADYALAPEQPFPAAMNDVRALHEGLVAEGFERIALCGDSAGGGLALSFLTDRAARPDRIVGVVGMSPWNDLSASGESMVSRANDDPLVSRESVSAAAAVYLGGRSPDAQASPLSGDISVMPPVHIHVGDAEVLLDDSLRFARRAEQSGIDCEVHVWKGMVHVFPANVAMLQAANAALQMIGSFLQNVLKTDGS